LSDVDTKKEDNPMERRLPEVVGVRRTGWAAPGTAIRSRT